MQEVVSASDPLVQRCKALYVETFPAEERVHEEWFDQILHKRATEGEDLARQGKLFALLDDRKFLGFACCSSILASPGEHVCALYYMAILPTERCKGAGTFLYRGLKNAMRNDAALRKADHIGILFEVEKTELAVSDMERLQRERRIAFYKRLGCRILKVDYVQPSLGEGKEPLPLHLAFDGDRTDDDALCRLWYRVVFGIEES